MSEKGEANNLYRQWESYTGCDLDTDAVKSNQKNRSCWEVGRYGER